MKTVFTALCIALAVCFTALVTAPAEAGNNGASRHNGGYAKKHHSRRKVMRKRRMHKRRAHKRRMNKRSARRYKMRRQGGYRKYRQHRKLRRYSRSRAERRFAQKRRGKHYRYKRGSRRFNRHKGRRYDRRQYRGRHYDRRRFKGRRNNVNNRINVSVASFASSSAFAYSAPRFYDDGYNRREVVYNNDNSYYAYDNTQADYGYAQRATYGYAPAYAGNRAYTTKGYNVQQGQRAVTYARGYWHWHADHSHQSRGHVTRYHRRQGRAHQHRAGYKRRSQRRCRCR